MNIFSIFKRKQEPTKHKCCGVKPDEYEPTKCAKIGGKALTDKQLRAQWEIQNTKIGKQ